MIGDIIPRNSAIVKLISQFPPAYLAKTPFRPYVGDSTKHEARGTRPESAPRTPCFVPRAFPLMPSLNDLIANVKTYDPEADLTQVREAYAFAEEAHSGQRRVSGESYMTHCMATAMNLADMHMPPSLIVAGLLHDVPEDTKRTVEEIEAKFGKEVADVVRGITKLGKLKYRGIERYMENLRKMFLAMAEDVRVIIVKFADRLHNLETLDVLPPKKQYRVALESLEIFAPIANRLGMGEMKGKMEDLAFKYVYPKEYTWVSEMSQKTREGKRGYLAHVMETTRKMLENAGIKNAEVNGREKYLYSLYRKLVKHERDIARIYDLMAIRVILPTIADCYAALGVIHGTWSPLKGRIKDYIAQPKPNGYRSLHTTVFCDKGEIVEFQIRTREMHNVDEFGIAAHWRYDEKGKKSKKQFDAQSKDTEWMSQLTDVQHEIADKRQFLHALEELKIDVFRDRIFVFTPKGDVIELPEDSTPVDFAYAIHTDLGNKCTASKVNDEMAPLNRTLKSGDIVQIVVDKTRKGPNPDWIKFVKTRHAKNRVRQFAKQSITGWIKGLIPGSKG
jgi:GTP diphosphokinase / guanosine-3',5'-bis(diphosphate) 3'-diphosphatase